MIALVIVVVLANLVRLVKPARAARLREQIGRIKILPRDGGELAVFLLVSLTAGVVEELLYRGYLIWFFSSPLGLYGAIAFTSLVFGIGHAYQGWRGVVQTGALGLLFAIVYVATESCGG